MTNSRNPLYQALQYALVPGAMASFALASSTVFAQDSSDEESSTLERVQVTGSRLVRLDVEGANPVTVLDRDDIKRTGVTDLGELIQDLPMMSGSPTSSQQNNGGNGRVAVDLRGLGTNRTLVLINGDRLPALFNDFSTIPTVMVERIEILKDGASAIYGADAVAGVVNIITRRDFQGAEFQAQYGQSFDLKGPNSSLSFITGGNSDRGNFVVGAEYVRQEEVFLAAYDQKYLKASVTVYDPVGFHEYGFSGDSRTDLNGNGINEWATFGSSRIPYGRFDLSNAIPGATSWTVCQNSATGGASVSDYGPRSGPDACGDATYDFAPVNYMQTPYERSSFFSQADYELFDNVTATLETRFANRRSQQILASQPYDSRFDPGYGDIEPGVAISKDNYYNPFGVDIKQWRRRFIETGGRVFDQNVDQWQIVAGLEGEISESWTWDLSYNYGRVRNSSTDYGQFAGGNLANALGPSFMDADGNIVCGVPGNVIPGCVSLNAFTNPDTNPITQDMLDYFAVPLNDLVTNTRQITDFNVVGNAYELPAGPLGVAVGFERRSENYVFIPDSGKTLGIVTGNTGQGTDGAYNVDSFYGELNIPILAGVTGAELLEIGVSARYDDFSLFDASTTWQGAFRWKPVNSLLLRATAGTVYREPNISELFAGVGDSFPNASDPCSNNGGNPGCENVPVGYTQGDAQVASRIGGNINITPEEGDTVTAGLAWSPEFASGLTMTLDWWKIQIDDSINTPSANVVLAGCFSGAVPAFCDNIERFGPETSNYGDLKSVLTLVQKVGPESAEGIDWQVGYNWDTEIGLWDFMWYGSYNISRKELVLKDPDGDGVDQAYLGEVAGLFEHRSLGGTKAFPEWRWRFDTDWSLGDWGVSLSVEFIDGVTECGSPTQAYTGVYCPDDSEIVSLAPEDTVYGLPPIETAWINTTDDVYYFDLVGNYTVPGWGTEISMGIVNLTDEPLPFINQGFNATTDENTFRAAGRSWFVSLTHSF